ncbi:MAG: type II secretion system minor pseudopilin GspI [Gammaproteobacteria bacterium]|nr:type II secretion system minor pseudopilin GspI [Gammaproteobacteria bacterium]
MNGSLRPRTGGFTLIEVLVALAIVAIGMAAVLESLTSSANTALFLQDKTFADWVALNRIETVRLSNNIPAVGTSSDTLDYAGRSWEWQQKVTATKIPGMVQIEVDVRPANSQAGDDRGWYGSATGFVGNAFAPPTTLETFQWWWNPSGAGPTPGSNPSQPQPQTGGSSTQ